MKHDVIHKTGSTERIARPPEEDRATATGNMHKNLVKFGHVLSRYASGQTDKHTHHNTSHPSRSNKLHRQRSEAISSHTRQVIEIPILGYLEFGATFGYLATSGAVILLLGEPNFLQGQRNFAPILLSFRDLKRDRQTDATTVTEGSYTYSVRF